MEAAPSAPTTWPQVPALPHLLWWLVDNCVANQDGIVLLCCEIQGTSFAVLTYQNSLERYFWSSLAFEKQNGGVVVVST